MVGAQPTTVQSGPAVILLTFGVLGATTAGGVFIAGGRSMAHPGPKDGLQPAATNASTIDASRSEEPTMGGSISSFMQATDADAEQTVDTELFEAKFEHANRSERTALVRERVAELERRLERIRDRKAALREDMEEGTVNPSDRARATRLAVKVRGLRRAIASTEAAATRADIPVDMPRLETLRRNASTIPGAEESRLAPSPNATEDSGQTDGPPDTGGESPELNDSRSSQSPNSTGNERN